MRRVGAISPRHRPTIDLISDMASWSSLLFGAQARPPKRKCLASTLPAPCRRRRRYRRVAADRRRGSCRPLLPPGGGGRRESILFSLFTLFLATTGLAHFASAFALWMPDPSLESALNAASAVLALITAIVFWRWCRLVAAPVARPARSRDRRPSANPGRAEGSPSETRRARRSAHQGIGRSPSSASRSRFEARRSRCSARIATCAMSGCTIHRPG